MEIICFFKYCKNRTLISLYQQIYQGEEDQGSSFNRFAMILFIVIFMFYIIITIFVCVQWNDTIGAFRKGVPRGKHRRYMRTVDDCFVGSTAVDWLQNHLKQYKEFGTSITRQVQGCMKYKLIKCAKYYQYSEYDQGFSWDHALRHLPFQI